MQKFWEFAKFLIIFIILVFIVNLISGVLGFFSTGSYNYSVDSKHISYNYDRTQNGDIGTIIVPVNTDFDCENTGYIKSVKNLPSGTNTIYFSTDKVNWEIADNSYVNTYYQEEGKTYKLNWLNNYIVFDTWHQQIGYQVLGYHKNNAGMTTAWEYGYLINYVFWANNNFLQVYENGKWEVAQHDSTNGDRVYFTVDITYNEYFNLTQSINQGTADIIVTCEGEQIEFGNNVLIKGKTYHVGVENVVFGSFGTYLFVYYNGVEKTSSFTFTATQNVNIVLHLFDDNI